jgi:hypothetical protein
MTSHASSGHGEILQDLVCLPGRYVAAVLSFGDRKLVAAPESPKPWLTCSRTLTAEGWAGAHSGTGSLSLQPSPRSVRAGFADLQRHCYAASTVD